MLLRAILYCIPVIFLSVIVYLWNKEAKLGRESLTWPRTTAIIKNANRSSKRESVTFEYVVNGVTYKGHNIDYCSVRNEESKAFFDEYIKNAHPIDISYSPEDPSLSVIVPGTGNREEHGYWSAGVSFLVFLLVMELVYRRFRSKKKTEQGAAANP